MPWHGGIESSPRPGDTGTRPRRDPTRRRRARVALIGGGLALLLAAGGTTAWALDRFVIEHVEIADVAAYEAAQATSTPTATPTVEATEPVLTDTSYTSDDASITISTVTTGSGADTVTYTVADVVLADATVLRSAFAQNAFGENITQLPSEIAADHGAVLAINGDYSGFRTSGIVIRNGVIYRDEPARDALVLFRDGTAAVVDETTTSAQDLLDAGAWTTLSFGPALVEDGAILDGIESVEVDTNVGNHSIQGEQPRTAIGVIGENHLVLVVVDGRQEGYSRGMTMTELAQLMVDLGAETAYNLDGGGSSVMLFGGEIITSPSNGGERTTSDILYVAG